MRNETTWIVNGTLVTPSRLVRGSLAVRDGRIVEVRKGAAVKSGKRIAVIGQHVAPGFIDLHIWGEPKQVSAREAASGTTSFLHAVGPEPPQLLINRLFQLERQQAQCRGATCLGVHLEGPFLNPLRAGALASRWLRPPTVRELLRSFHINRVKRVPIIKINSCHRKIRHWILRFFNYANDFPIANFRHAKPLRIFNFCQS